VLGADEVTCEDPCETKGCMGPCRVTDGEAVCSCEPGWMLAADLVGCIDLCGEKKCSFACDATSGAAICSCPVGMGLGPDERTCEGV